MESIEQPQVTKSISRFQSSNKSSSNRSTISSFHTKYKISKKPSSFQNTQKTKDTPCDNSSMDSSDEEGPVYHLDLETPGAFDSKDMSYVRANGTGTKRLFDSLSTISKLRLQKFENENSLSKDEIRTLRVFKGDSIMQFDDFINISFFNQNLTRENHNNNYANFGHENLFVFNNMIDVACLTLDLDLLSFVLTPIYKPKDNEFVSFVNVGTGDYKNVVLIGLMGERKVSFFDIEGRVKLFDTEFPEYDQCAINGVNRGNELFLLFLDNKIAKFDIETDECISEYNLAAVEGLETVYSLKVADGVVLISSNLGIHMLNDEDNNFQLIFSQNEDEGNRNGPTEYIFASNGKILIAAKRGDEKIYSVNYAKEALVNSLDFQTEETQILDIAVNGDFTEFAVLMNTKEDGKMVKKVSLGYVSDGKIEDFDLILVQDNVRTIRYIAKSDHFMAEGEGTFSIYETKNQELTESLKKKIQNKIEEDEADLGAAE